MNNPMNSAKDAIERFSTPEAAEKYNRALVGTAKHQREMAALETALLSIPPGSSVLDFPCGTGRLYPMLQGKGYEVTAVDSSFHMAAIARNNRNPDCEEKDRVFGVSDILQTAFADKSFDAVVCNRLFHHFFEAEIRRQAFAELNRISRNTIVVSYYSNQCLDALTFKLKNWLRRKQPTDRVPIDPGVFAADAASAGLRVLHEIPSRSVVSMQTYAVLEPQN